MNPAEPMFRQHRERFLSLLQRERAAAVLPAGGTRTRNADTDYRFRPHSDFFYLTGFREPDAVLVLLPDDRPRSILFLRGRDPDQELWTGRRLGVEAAPEVLGVDQAFALEELWERLPGLLAGSRRVVYRFGEHGAMDARMVRSLERLRMRVRAGGAAPLEWADPALWLHEQRLFKSEGELACMRRAAQIAVEAHRAAMRHAQPGRNECELDALLEYTFRRRGGTGAAYPNIVAGGANACILHYVENDQALVDGELVLVDAGAEWNYYASDVTRTYPVNGTFSPEQRALYEVVLAAQRAALAFVRPGTPVGQPHEAAVERLVAGLLELGLLRGTAEHVLEEQTYLRFYMHKTGHWLGLDVHDCGAYFRDGEARKLEPGMLTTVEPGLYVAPDDDTVEARWRGIGIRIEDDVLVTDDGHEVLSEALASDVDEVEAVCQGQPLETAGSGRK